MSEREIRWSSVGRGVIVAILSALLLSFATRFIAPEIVDTVEGEPGRARESNLIGLGVWTIAIVLGMWEVVRVRRKARRDQSSTVG